MLACRNTRPGFVQRWPTNRSPAVRSVRRWKPRSLTSKPGGVAPDLAPHPPDDVIRERFYVLVPPGTARREARPLPRRHRVEHAHGPSTRRLPAQLCRAEDGGVRRHVDEAARGRLRFERRGTADAA